MRYFSKAALSGAFVGLALASSTGLARAASTVAPFYIHYDINSLYDVTDLALLEEIQGSSYGITYGGGQSAPAGMSTTTDPFEKYQPIADTFLLGVATDLPGDSPGQQHAVLFTNDTFAISAQNIAFGTLFPNTDEDTLIAALENEGGSSTSPDLFQTVVGFANGDATTGPNGNLAFAPGDQFTEIAFSTGQIIGTGTSYETAAGMPVSAAPEPSTWALLMFGVGAIGLALRRSKQLMGLFSETTAA